MLVEPEYLDVGVDDADVFRDLDVLDTVDLNSEISLFGVNQRKLPSLSETRDIVQNQLELQRARVLIHVGDQLVFIGLAPGDLFRLVLGLLDD